MLTYVFSGLYIFVSLFTQLFIDLHIYTHIYIYLDQARASRAQRLTELYYRMILQGYITELYYGLG